MEIMTTANFSTPAANRTVLDLSVRNHAGVLSHVCSLFARRAFNLDGIICLPVGDAATSKLWLLVAEDDRLEQIVKQLQKLEDVLSVVRSDEGMKAFASLIGEV
jgi:acetolactate synthase-1/3 small subunit